MSGPARRFDRQAIPDSNTAATIQPGDHKSSTMLLVHWVTTVVTSEPIG
jgi:hypothetical protein